jgi:hypothetical protein
MFSATRYIEQEKCCLMDPYMNLEEHASRLENLFKAAVRGKFYA